MKYSWFLKKYEMWILHDVGTNWSYNHHCWFCTYLGICIRYFRRSIRSLTRWSYHRHHFASILRWNLHLCFFLCYCLIIKFFLLKWLLNRNERSRHHRNLLSPFKCHIFQMVDCYQNRFLFCSKSVVEIEVDVGEDLEQRHQK